MADQDPAFFPPGADLVALFNQHRGGFEHAIGLVFTKITPDELVCEVPVGVHLTQPYGLVHGGVYSSIVETLGSVGAALHAMPRGQTSVGLENTTSFVRAVRTGTLVATARPVHRGSRSQVWQVEIHDAAGKLAATGRLRTLSLEQGASIAGETVQVKT
ncbi:MAG: ComA operon protein 2 [Deltaproteobacteria bacterium]|nr:ComA operon protein 2 [Deltaproteobacteria bacterium]